MKEFRRNELTNASLVSHFCNLTFITENSRIRLCFVFWWFPAELLAGGTTQYKESQRASCDSATEPSSAKSFTASHLKEDLIMLQHDHDKRIQFLRLCWKTTDTPRLVFAIFVKTLFFKDHLISKVFEKVMRVASKIFAWERKFLHAAKICTPDFAA